MSIKIIKDFGSDLTHSINVADIFNPVINKLWTNQFVTLKQWLDIQKSLYCRENLTAHPEFFFPTVFEMYSSNNTVITEVINKRILLLNDDLLYLLPYFKYGSTEGAHGVMGFKFEPYCNSGSNDTYLQDMRSDHLKIGARTASEETYKTALNKAFREIEAVMMTVWEGNYHKIFSVSNTVSMYGESDILHYLKSYVCNRKLYVSNNGMLTAKDVYSAMTVPGCNMVPKIQFHSGFSRGYVHEIKFTQVISNYYRDPLYKQFSYSENVLRVLDKKRLVAPDEEKKTPILYGVELETASEYRFKDLIDAQKDLFFICKSDVSISGKKGVHSELVTLPMSLKAQRKQWADWFSKIDYNKFDCSTETTNGMHVHIDRKAFGGNEQNKAHVRNMTWFLTNPANRDFVVAISERGNYAAMQRYTPITSFDPSWSKVKCFRNCVSRQGQHRGIINFQKDVTIEIRMFKGIVSYASVIKNLEFVDSLLHFSEGMNSFQELTLRHYVSWLTKTSPNKYTVLKKFIIQFCDIDNTMAAADLMEICGAETDPEKILEKLKKAGVKLTSKHVTLLNKGRTRTFVLNKETSEVEVVVKNKSKLAFMDRLLEKRYATAA